MKLGLHNSSVRVTSKSTTATDVSLSDAANTEPSSKIRENLFEIFSDIPRDSSIAEKIAKAFARTGNSVCLVNSITVEPLPHEDIVPHQDTKNLYVLFTGDANKILEACDNFDYVITEETVGDHRRVSTLSEYVGRAFYVSQYPRLDGAERMLEKISPDRIYAIHAGDKYTYAGLFKEPSGHLRLIDRHTGEQVDPGSNSLPTSIPTIAIWGPGYFHKDIVNAMLGVEGSFAPFYMTDKQIQRIQKTRNRTEIFQWSATLTSALSACSFGTFFGGGLPVVGISLGAGLVSYIVASRVSARTNKNVNNETIVAEMLESDPERTQIVHQLLPPPVGIVPKKREISPLAGRNVLPPVHKSIWEKTLNSYEEIQEKWLSYELDVMKSLDAPLMLDYSCPTTASFVKQYRIASDLSSALRESEGTHIRNDFVEAVHDLSIKFDAAERFALTRGIHDYTEGDQTKIKTGRKLFALALDPSTSDHEKKSALKAAKTQLEGVLLVPQKAVLQITAGLS
jgi:hypothetical protein